MKEATLLLSVRTNMGKENQDPINLVTVSNKTTDRPIPTILYAVDNAVTSNSENKPEEKEFAEPTNSPAKEKRLIKTPGKIKFTKCVRKNKEIKLCWKKVRHAKKYEVYQKKGNTMFRKLLIAALCVAILFAPSVAAAQDEKPYDMLRSMETKLPDFGERPWEKNLQLKQQNHKSNVKLACLCSQEKRAEEIHKEKEKKQREKERKRMLSLQAKTQDKYTNEQNTKIVEAVEGSTWKSIGNKRITHYCPVCNTPSGSYASSSGTKLFDGAVACSWLPMGSMIKINEKVYRVLDRCGTDAIDIFRDTPDGCSCNSAGSYYAEIFILD